MPSPLSENLAAAKARLQAARSPGVSSIPSGSGFRSGFLTPRVATPGTLLEHGLEVGSMGWSGLLGLGCWSWVGMNLTSMGWKCSGSSP